ncbi:hypothetical protein [Escherichia coli ISC7]|uniref:Uncharacterized protein n=1 Tax=Escherichia coli ISC7 TaxID=1432555 RepID=W1F6U6_ECOLX|nr:hypothetical protein [Escherichia coli ISC7]
MPCSVLSRVKGGSSQDMVWSSSLCEDGTGKPVPLWIN